VILEEKRKTKSDFVFTLVDIVTNEEFLRPIIGVLCFLLCLEFMGEVATATSCRLFLETMINPSDDPVSLIASVMATSLLMTAVIAVELLPLLVLLMAHSLHTCRFLDSMSLYDATTMTTIMAVIKVHIPVAKSEEIGTGKYYIRKFVIHRVMNHTLPLVVGRWTSRTASAGRLPHVLGIHMGPWNPGRCWTERQSLMWLSSSDNLLFPRSWFIRYNHWDTQWVVAYYG
jgi:hypothetical protein